MNGGQELTRRVFWLLVLVALAASGAGRAGTASKPDGDSGTDATELTITIVKPRQTVYYFDDKVKQHTVLIEATVVEMGAKGKRQDIKTILWTVSQSTREKDFQDWKELSSTTEPVAGPKGKRVCRLSRTFSSKDMPKEADVVKVRVRATATLPAGVPTPPPIAEIVLTLKRPGERPEIWVARPSFGYTEQSNNPIQFKLYWRQPAKSISWTFGDGSSDTTNNPTPVHSYKQHGTFTVSVTATGSRGRTFAAQPRNVSVAFVPPKALPRILHEGQLVGEDIASVPANRTVVLTDASTGDIVSRRWYLNGKPLEAGQKSLPLEDPGNYTLALEVRGPAGNDGTVGATDRAAVECKVTPSRDIVRPAITALILLIVYLGVVWRVFSRNEPRAWRVYYGIDEEHVTFKQVGDFWSRWRKEARIPMARLFPDSEYWHWGRGKSDRIVVRCAVKRRGVFSGSLAFTGDGDPDVTWAEVRAGETDKSYALKDERAVEEEAYREARFRLAADGRASRWGMLFKVLFFVAFCGILWWVWHVTNPPGSW